MTGVFIAAVNNVKNLLHWPWKRQGADDQQSNGGPKLYSLGGGAFSRKRPLERVIHIEREIELTDDEDEVPASSKTWNAFYERTTNCYTSKRFKGEETSEEMERRRIITRGSGLSPDIPGEEKQPWEFNFRRKPRRKTPIPEEPGTKLGNDEASTSKSSAPERNLGEEREASQGRGSKKTDNIFSKFRFGPVPPTLDKNIEVITIIDEAPTPAVPGGERGSTSSGGEASGSASASGRGCRKLNSVMQQSKPIMKPKSTFVSMLTGGGIGRKAVDPISTTVRLEEKHIYRDLIEKMNNQTSFLGRHLSRSKVNSREVSAMYHTWNYKSPNVSLSIDYQPSGFSKDRTISDRIRRDLTLFSTPAASRSSGSTPLGPPSPPILVDLEEERQEKPGSEVVPYTESPPMRRDLSFSTSYADLEDALTSTKHADGMNDSLAEYRTAQELVLSGGDKSEEVDDDITILTENILDNCSSRRYNSLALEQNTSPYVNRTWRNGMSTAYREKQKWREQQIKEYMTMVDVLNTESTLEKDLREDIRRKLTLTEIIVLEEAPPKLPEITEDMRIIISTAKRPGREDDILAKVFNIDFTRGDVKTLAPCKWLNDNVINAYMELITQRSKTSPELPKVHAFTTFFYPKLLKEGYSNPLKRWTRKVDLFENDLIVFPIHLGLHWCLACADLRTKSISYYDSLGGRNDRCLNSLLNYLTQEMKERKGQLLNRDEWTLDNVEGVPQQQNGSDCGVFTCKFAEYLSRDARLTFLQENMDYYRDRMVYEIIKNDLLFP